MTGFERYGPVVKRDPVRRVVMGEVLVPDRMDAQGDRVDAATVERAAYEFLSRSRTVGANHRLFKGIGEVVESFIARPGDPEFTPGAWVLGVRCTPETWARVEAGELVGFSIGGRGKRINDL